MRKLKSVRKGNASIEWVILSPLIIMTMMLLLYVMFIGLSYVQFGNLANSIAQDLNMGKSGYEDSLGSTATIKYQVDEGKIVTSGNGSMMDGFAQFLNGFKESSTNEKVVSLSVAGSDSGGYKRSALAYSVDRHKDRFHSPGITVENIDLEAIHNNSTNFSMDKKKMSTSISITIKYKCFGLPFEVKGYNVII